MKTFEVTAKVAGAKRSRTHLAFKTKAEAQKYADDTDRYYPGANAKVVQGAQTYTKKK